MPTITDVADEVPRYRGKRRVVTPKKHNHKHDFQPCLFNELFHKKFTASHGFVADSQLAFGEYCVTCGKIAHSYNTNRWLITVRVETENGGIRAYKQEYTSEALRELDPATRTLPVFTKYTLLQRYIWEDEL